MRFGCAYRTSSFWFKSGYLLRFFVMFAIGKRQVGKAWSRSRSVEVKLRARGSSRASLARWSMRRTSQLFFPFTHFPLQHHNDRRRHPLIRGQIDIAQRRCIKYIHHRTQPAHQPLESSTLSRVPFGGASHSFASCSAVVYAAVLQYVHSSSDEVRCKNK